MDLASLARPEGCLPPLSWVLLPLPPHLPQSTPTRSHRHLHLHIPTFNNAQMIFIILFTLSKPPNNIPRQKWKRKSSKGIRVLTSSFWFPFVDTSAILKKRLK